MTSFQVEADFFFSADVQIENLLKRLREDLPAYVPSNIVDVTFNMSSVDVLDVSFVVTTANTSAETMRVSKKFLDQLTETVTELLAQENSETSMEDDSLLLMPA